MRDAGLVAEFSTKDELRRAVERLRAEGYRDIETFTPVPVADIDRLLGPRPSAVTRIAGTAAATGVIFAYGLQWLLNAVLYPIDVGGRPPHSAPAFVPITFETGVLFTGIATFLAVLALSGLPRLWRPIFEIEGFTRASVDRWFLLVSADDPRFDWGHTRDLLSDLYPLRVVTCAGRPS